MKLLKKVGIVLVVLVVLGVIFGGGGKSDSDEPAVQSASESTETQEAATSEEADTEEETEEVDKQHLAIGDSVSFNDGTTVTVNEVQTGLSDYEGSPVTRINVTYVNDGNDSISFNGYDWKTEDANGVQRDVAFMTDTSDRLDSGNLSAGGTVSGNVYLEGEATRIIYQNNIFLDSTQVGWDVQ